MLSEFEYGHTSSKILGLASGHIQIENEIAAKRLTFSSLEERQAYKDMRLQQEIIRRGLDVCV
jgi:hypothetical protein